MDVMRARWWILALIGLVGGVLSGAFGVGGGIVMVPMLMLFAGLDQRRASATSLLAILPTAASGSITYLIAGEIDWAAAALLAAGAVSGSFIGTWLLRRLPLAVLRWLFIVLLLVVAVRLALTEPVRADPLELSAGVVIAYLAVGLVMGVCSGLFGIGGGAVAVPALVALLGVSDLIAKGTSLVAMIPTSITGTIANTRAGLTDLRDGLVTGVAAAVAAVPGALLAQVMAPRVSALLFAGFLLLVCVQLAVRAVRLQRAARAPRSPAPLRKLRSWIVSTSRAARGSAGGARSAAPNS
ncbi:sulfite exporter TauE/SafE family protein [Galbitalea sp. SE-J8]|nr:sulfite exporter TauE/SafE family protein [Galbitalea sp. SE-J8]MDM4761814.1 sulfite exporter TauE/SafE family protein [Galbitalea sp. SE-J8]